MQKRMNSMRELGALIEQCIRDTAAERDVPIPQQIGRSTRLFGRNGVFDSLGLVSLIAAVEVAVEDALDVSITLADERAMSQKASPFVDVASLARYIESLLDEAS
jgi:acyl carrier protein